MWVFEKVGTPFAFGTRLERSNREGEGVRMIQRVAKLSGQIREMFERDLEFMLMTPYSDGEDSPLVNLIYRNRRAKKIVSGNDLVYPIEIKEALFGAAIVRDGITLSTGDQEKIEMLIDLVLVSYLIASDANERSKQLETYLNVMTSDNVIYMDRVRTRNPVFQEEVRVARHQAPFLTPILIEGKPGTDFHNLAFDIHQRAQGRSFISWTELDPAQMKKPEDLVDLGPITLFIPDLSRLTEAQQEFLDLYLLDFANEETPRIIAAIQNPVEDLIEKKEIRRSLGFYFSKAHIKIPPLSERKEDLTELIDFFSQAHSQGQKDLSSFGPEALSYLTEYDWPGNEKELETDVRKMVDQGSDKIGVEALPVKIIGSEVKQLLKLAHSRRSLKEASEELEEKMLMNALQKAGGNKSEASRLLGLSRSAFLEKLERIEKSEM